ncbi:BI1-like protein [Hibiscus syriacus]|uniref:BI1-like protein n=1 Tax=Hibiscus syriacus TaxID=106335 RepID=A0A6A3D5R0_HIBSY|nr:BI1-like protein [Hibiscus syriacus]
MGFIRKVYGILAAQLVLTTVVSAFVVVGSCERAPPWKLWLLALLFLCLVPFVLLWPLHIYHQKHPVNLIILGLFTVFLSLTVGVSCANTDGRIVLEALILTAGCLIILILTGLIQMFFPLGSTSTAFYGGISAFIFCGYVVFDTDNLIKRFTYDDYILASATLYLDILNLFISILRVLRSGDN